MFFSCSFLRCFSFFIEFGSREMLFVDRFRVRKVFLDVILKDLGKGLFNN